VDKLIAEGSHILSYRDMGSGEPVLLLHGFAEDGAVWSELAQQLIRDEATGSDEGLNHRLLIPDLPGSGRSTLTPPVSMGSSAATTSLSVESMADALKGLLDREGIERCILIGHSMGGYIALAFAELYPGRLRAFGLFHSTAYADSDEKKAARRKSISFIREHGVQPFFRQSIPALFANETRTDRPGLVEDMISRYSGFSADSLTAYLEAMLQRPDRVPVLERSDVPILFVIGEKDQIVLPEQSLAQVSIPALSFLDVLPGAGHMGMLEEPAAGAAIIQSFVNFVIHL
jgi:pimeloyl-ACP methyl ester carboxylesterase